jgi:hypothetical protein
MCHLLLLNLLSLLLLQLQLLQEPWISRLLRQQSQPCHSVAAVWL